DLTALAPLDAQAQYSERFDRGRAPSLVLFEHVHGEARDRGQAMVDLLAQYERHGGPVMSREVPDQRRLYLADLALRPLSGAGEGLW
ncbi:nitrate reductase molybdenum cofactor assembly chaperone, partial [Escherichia coli]